MANLIQTAVTLLWSMAVLILFPVLFLIAKMTNQHVEQFSGRMNPANLAEEIRTRMQTKRRSIVFYVSSAGEFEQAKPIIARIQKTHPELFIHIFFHSVSGFKYAKAKKESLSYSLSPMDTVWHWGWLYAALQPIATVVVRYELWPSHIETAANYGKLFLVNADPPAENAAIGNFIKSLYLRRVDHVFTVSNDERDKLLTAFNLPNNKVTTTGDSKYDSVIERAEASINTIEKYSSDKRLFVAGSVYPEDIELIASQILEASSQWHFILAPHNIDEAGVTAIEDQLKQSGVSFHRYTSQKINPTEQVTILDTMGMLAEVYRLADAAWVGGAIGGKVHNVLEPAVYGIPLAFGPQYNNSREAIHMVQGQCATVVKSGSQFTAWLKGVPDTCRDSIRSHVRELMGASEKIVAEIINEIESNV